MLEKEIAIEICDQGTEIIFYIYEFVMRKDPLHHNGKVHIFIQELVEEIMTAGKPVPDPGGIPGGLRWDVPGALRGSKGTWELVIHPEINVIYHFNFK